MNPSWKNHSLAARAAQAQSAPMGHTSGSTLGQTLATHKVLRNTYALLSMTLIWAAAVAAGTAALGLPHPGIIVTLVGYFGLLFLIHKTQSSAWAIPSVFALTGPKTPKPQAGLCTEDLN